ncbi:MAG TPA: type IV secretory system conjugative DNA transfer family protein [Acidimicrobiales bacterium]|nr:type IV secretory system conjugative DNA transfer family protein [Acidimicrobiales bacterium]
MASPALTLADWRARVAYAGSPLYLGTGRQGLTFAPPQQGMLVLGPPRSGKTTSLVIPNVLLAPGAVVSTSTKPDVLAATAAERVTLGRCWLFDPSGQTTTPPGVTQLRWSPVVGCQEWDTALRTARAMTLAARPSGYQGDQTHWTERAEALIGPLLHAAALHDLGMSQVSSWILSHDLQGPMDVLARSSRSRMAVDTVLGLDATEDRELSGIFSTAAGVVAAYRSDTVLDQAREPNFDPRRFPATSDTVYVCAPGRDQSLLAPLVIGLLEQIRAGAYRSTAQAFDQNRRPGPPVALVLDEAANIAPLPDLPAIVSEGGSQGLVTLACFQDLSQARSRWGPGADGFMTLFGTNVVLGGIRDMRTLDQISRLAGDVEVPHNSVTGRPFPLGRRGLSVTRSTRRQPRLPVNEVAQLRPGQSILLTGPNRPTLLGLTPWFQTPPFLAARRSLQFPPPAAQDRIISLDRTR